MKTRMLFCVLGLLLLFEGSRVFANDDKEQAEIRDATAQLIASLEAEDPSAWVYMYTSDAVLLEPGTAPIAGRPALLAMAKTMAPLSAVKISPERTECSGNLAYMYGRASWINGRPPAEGTASNVYLVIVWRKEADGQWRVAQEVFVPDTPEK